MTDFLSAYGFVTIGVILLIVSLIFKAFILYFLDALCWLMAGIYAMSNYDPAQPFIFILGVFFIAVAIAMFARGIIVNRKPKELWRDPNDPYNWDEEAYEERAKEMERRKRLNQ